MQSPVVAMLEQTLRQDPFRHRRSASANLAALASLDLQ
jgi:hypothetical protein